MSGPIALTLGAVSVGSAPVVGALHVVRCVHRPAAATHGGLAGPLFLATGSTHLQLAGTARASEATGARPRLVAAADPSPHS